MTTRTARPSREIDGKGRSVRELLAGRKYSIDYYQREYKWQKKQVADLLDDLAAKFLESHDEGNDRSAVADYSHYFLGSIIICDKDGQKFIIDGQQRLTTLTLLLIFVQHQLEDDEQKGQIADLIFSQKYGKCSFNLDIPERAACMDALYKGEEFPEPDPSESIANILARFSELEDLFPDELGGAALTSANLTEAALDRNIEVGLLVRDRALAATVSSHFRGLIDRKLLSLLPME